MTRAEQCVEWIKNTKGIDFHDRFGLIPLILEWADTHPYDELDESFQSYYNSKRNG